MPSLQSCLFPQIFLNPSPFEFSSLLLLLSHLSSLLLSSLFYLPLSPSLPDTVWLPVMQAGLELLPRRPACWDDRQVPLQSPSLMLFTRVWGTTRKLWLLLWLHCHSHRESLRRERVCAGRESTIGQLLTGPRFIASRKSLQAACLS